MDRTLAKTVHVEHQVHGQVRFLAGTVPPAWAQEVITNPKAWVVDAEPEPVEPDRETDPTPDPAPDVPDTEPPRSGNGSGRDRWAAFAAAHGVGVTEGMSRDDIAAAWDNREV